MLEAIMLLNLMDRKGGLRCEYELHEEQECQARKKSLHSKEATLYTHLLAAVFKNVKAKKRTLKEQIICLLSGHVQIVPLSPKARFGKYHISQNRKI
jgi:hypothetical protein